MEWNLKIPRILHTYWGGGVLPYLRYLTVKSFIQFNPEWRVIVWTPRVPSVKRTWDSNHQDYEVECTDYTEELFKLPVETHKVDFSTWGFNNSISEVHKSDYLRLYLLTFWGGVWSDMDIIYFKPMTRLAANRVEHKDSDTFVCIGGYGHSAGFIMSARGSSYYKSLMELSEREFDPNGYQSIGATMFNKYYPTLESVRRVSPSAVNIDMDAVYAHDAFKTAELMNGKKSLFTDRSIGMHWYGGHPSWGKFLKDTDGGRENLPDGILRSVIKSLE